MLRPGLVLLALLVPLPVAVRGQDVAYRVVVHRTNNVSRLSREQVSRIFLRKITQWDNHQPMLPVDQGSDSPVRRTFTKQIHQKTIAAVAPPERAGDADVLDYIRRYPNAIGYVRAGTLITSDFKTVDITP